MPSKQIPELPTLNEALAADDMLVVRDTSSGSDKSIAYGVLTGAGLNQVPTNADLRAENYTALRALSGGTGQVVEVSGRASSGDGGGGVFAWRAGDQGAEVQSDPSSGVWVAPDADMTGASGAWERLLNGSPITPAMYGGSSIAPANNGDRGVYFPKGAYSEAGLQIAAIALHGDGVASVITSSGSALGGDFKISGSDVTIDSLKLAGDAAQGIFAAANVTDVRVLNSEIAIAAATAGHGVQLNAASPARWWFIGDYISSSGYGILLNNNATDARDIIIALSIIENGGGDSITQNNPTSTFKNLIALGNILESPGGGINGGFAISIANGKNNLLLGNISKLSKQEAIHIEDGQERTIVAALILDECGENAVRVLRSGFGGAGGIGDPVIVALCHAKGDAANAESGIRLVYDDSGTLSGCPIVGNRLKGFGAAGIDIGRSRTVASANSIENSPIAMMANAGVQYGENYAKGCATLASANGNSIFGKILSDTKPTTILGRSGSLNPGNIIKGFNFPGSAMIHAGGANASFDLFAAGTLMLGRLTVTAQNQNEYFFVTADVHWDGTTFTASNYLLKVGGTIGSTVSFGVAAGQVQVTWNTIPAVTMTPIIDFDGVFYQE